MKWNFDDWVRKHGHNDIVAFAFIHCMVEQEKRTKSTVLPTKDYDIQFSINGIEMDFTDLLQAYEDQLDRLVAEEAAKLVNNKLTGLSDEIERIRNVALPEVREKLGLPRGDSDY